MRATYIVRPIQGEVCALTGPDLPYPQKFPNSAAAGNMAHHLGRITGGSVIYLAPDGRGFFIETIQGGMQPTGATPDGHGELMLEAKRTAFGRRSG